MKVSYDSDMQTFSVVDKSVKNWLLFLVDHNCLLVTYLLYELVITIHMLIELANNNKDIGNMQNNNHPKNFIKIHTYSNKCILISIEMNNNLA